MWPVDGLTTLLAQIDNAHWLNQLGVPKGRYLLDSDRGLDSRGLDSEGRDWSARPASTAMKYVLFFLRYLNRVKRRIFGRSLPNWLKDSMDAAEYINFVSMAPTFLMIVFRPDHFFKRVPSIASSSKSIYKTPIKFLTSGLTIIVLGISFFFRDTLDFFGITDKSTIYYSIFIFTLLSPVFVLSSCR
jgi:hypothetical protein